MARWRHGSFGDQLGHPSILIKNHKIWLVLYTSSFF